MPVLGQYHHPLHASALWLLQANVSMIPVHVSSTRPWLLLLLSGLRLASSLCSSHNPSPFSSPDVEHQVRNSPPSPAHIRKGTTWLPRLAWLPCRAQRRRRTPCGWAAVLDVSFACAPPPTPPGHRAHCRAGGGPRGRPSPGAERSREGSGPRGK